MEAVDCPDVVTRPICDGSNKITISGPKLKVIGGRALDTKRPQGTIIQNRIAATIAKMQDD